MDHGRVIDKTKKMASRDRGLYKDRKRAVERIKKSRDNDLQLPDFSETEYMADEDLAIAEPAVQWDEWQKLETEFNKLVTPAVAEQYRNMTGEELPAASSVQPTLPTATYSAEELAAKKKAEEEVALAALLVKQEQERKAAQKAEDDETMRQYNEKMATDPIYRAQMEIIMRNMALQAQAAGSPSPGGTMSTSAPSNTSAKRSAEGVSTGTVDQSGKKPDIRGSRLAQPALDVSKDLTEYSPTDEETPTAIEAHSLAARAFTSSKTAIDMVNQCKSESWCRMLCFMPQGWISEWLSSEIQRWRNMGWLGHDVGIAGCNERGTPAVLFLSDGSNDCFWSAQSAMNWCSGGVIRTVKSEPSELSQQEFQFRDWLRIMSDAYKAVQEEGMSDAQFVLCRPRRRPKDQRADPMCDADWWSLAVHHPKKLEQQKADTILRCEYDHTKMRMRYVFARDALAYVKVSRDTIEDKLKRETHTYYEYTVQITTSKLQAIREPKAGDTDAKVDKKDLDPTAASPPQPQAPPADPWKGSAYGDGGKVTGKWGGGKGGKNGWGKNTGKYGKNSGKYDSGAGKYGDSWNNYKGSGKYGKSSGKNGWGKYSGKY